MNGYPLLCLLLLFGIIDGQLMNGNLESLTVLPTCATSNLGSSTNLNQPLFGGGQISADKLGGLSTKLQPGDPLESRNTGGYKGELPCDSIPAGSKVTAMRIRLTPNKVNNGDKFAFSIGSLPSTLNTVTQPPPLDNPCQGTRSGDNCQISQYILTISYETSSAVEVFPLQLMPHIKVPYCYRWYQCNGISGAALNPPNSGGLPWVSPAEQYDCPNMASASIMNEAGWPANSDCTTIPRGTSGAILNSCGDNVCPTSSCLPLSEQKFYTSPEDSNAQSDCSLLFCPAGDFSFTGVGFLPVTDWNVGMGTSVPPYCIPAKIVDSQPSFRMNVILTLTVSDRNTKKTLRETKMLLSTRQNGALQVDSTGLIMAAIIADDAGSGTNGQPLGGGVLICNTDCDTDQNGSGKVCTPGLLSDIFAEPPTSSNEDDYLDNMMKAEVNPWDNEQAQEESCQVPTEYCRSLLLDQPGTKGFYIYVKSAEFATLIGKGCGKLGMDPNIYECRSDAASIMCRSRMNGVCYSGYQNSQSFQVGQGTVTPCETVLNWAAKLAGKNPGQQSYLPGVPEDHNPRRNQYWLNYLNYYRDLMQGGGDSNAVETILYVPEDYLGEVVTVAPGKFVDTAIFCNGVQGGANNGVLVFTVVNTGTITGNYRVTVNFNPPPGVQNGQSYVVTQGDLEVSFSLAPQQTYEGQISGWSYIGPNLADFSADGTLLSGDVQAFESSGEILSTFTLSCTVSSAASVAQIFEGDTAIVDLSNVNTVAQREATGYCEPYQIFKCWSGDWWFWMARLAFIAFLIAFSIGVPYILIADFQILEKLKKQSRLVLDQNTKREEAKARREAEKNEEKKETVEMIKSVLDEERPSDPIEPKTESTYTAGLNRRVSKRQKRRGGQINYTTPVTIITFLSLIALVQAQAGIQIMGIFSFDECVKSGQNGLGQSSTSNGVILNCTSSEFATTIVIRASPTTKQEAAKFAILLSVVPSNQGAVQKLFGDRCQAEGDQPCQLTVPATMSVEVTPILSQYELEPVDLISDATGGVGNFRVPFAYQLIQKSLQTTDYTAAKYHGATCTYQGQAFSSIGISKYKSFAMNQGTLNDIFNDPTPGGNSDQIKCDTQGGDVPVPLVDLADSSLGKLGKSYVEYFWSCKLSDGSQEMITTANYFRQLGPPCRIYSITPNPREVVAARVNITVPQIKDPKTGVILVQGHTESTIVSSGPDGIVGSYNVSSPFRWVSANIVRYLSASGQTGPYIQGYWGTCSSPDPTKDDPGYLSMDIRRSQLTSAADKQIYDDSLVPEWLSPWTFSPLSPNGQYQLFTPDSLAFCTNNDPYATMWYMNLTQVSAVCPFCTCVGVDPNIYSKSPKCMNPYYLFGSENPIRFPLTAILPTTMGGTGLVEYGVTCVPGFGLQMLDINGTTPCQSMSLQIGLEKQMQELAAANDFKTIQKLHIPMMPQWYNRNRNNMFKRGNNLYIDASAQGLGRAASEFAGTGQVEISITAAEKFLGYETPKPSGSISDTTFCNLFADPTNEPGVLIGGVYYQVCNPSNSKHGLASYQLHTECGWIDDLDPTTKDKFNGNTVVVDNTGLKAKQLTLNTDLLPSDISIVGVASNQCVSVGDEGAEKPFVIRGLYHSADITYSSTVANTITSTTPISPPSVDDLVDSSGNSRIACHVKLFSLQTLQPMSVVLAEQTISCVISVTSFSGGRASSRPIPSVIGGDALNEDSSDGDVENNPPPTPTASPDPNKGKPTATTEARIIVGVVFGLALVTLLILSIVNCIYTHRNEKVVGDLGKKASNSVKNAPKPATQPQQGSSTLKKVALLAAI